MYGLSGSARVRVFLLFSFFILCFAHTDAFASGQSQLWQPVDAARVPEIGRRQLSPEKSVSFRLDPAVLVRETRSAPLEFTSAARLMSVIVEMPMPDGTLQRFRIESSPVLAAHLAADFPEWRTFQGFGVDDPSATARFDWTKAGFHGYISTAKGLVYIDPVQENDKENYLVYYKHEYGGDQSGNFRCGTNEDFVSKIISTELNNRSDAVQFAYGSSLRTYKLAIATTGEWARGTTTSTDPQTVRTAALAALTTSVNRLDGIYRRELAATFQLVNPSITNDATNVIFDNPATDPYNNTDAEAQLAINNTTLNNRVGAANFDIGHLYGTGGGGVASSPSICSTQKGEGYSAREGFYGDPFTVDYVAHEIGHQFGANHTYNNMDSGGACTTRSNVNAFEVASGSTLMSYVGICTIRNLQQYVDGTTPAMHIRSLTEIVTNLQDTSAGSGGSCGTPVAGTNAVPTINAGPAYTIPKLTPFTLTASGADADAADTANLRYSWEEYDLAPSGTGQLGAPPLSYDVDTDGVQRPLFRAYSPVASASRTFPSIAFILNPAANSPAGSNNPPLTYTGTHATGAPGAVCQPSTECVVGENLPSIARTMNFRAAIRDGRGGIADAGTTVTTVNTSGPFQVTSQNAAAAMGAGSSQTVTWDVVGTNAAPINAANVKISLSTDGGQTFPTVLLESTPNDGSEPITVPNTASTTARIKVEAVGNIFFDINNANITITGGGAGSGVLVGDASARERGVGENRANGDGTIDFVISLSAPSAVPVTVRVSTNSGTATEGTDFVSLDNFLVTFPAGTTTQTVSVNTIEDPGDEPDETFTLDVDSVTNATVIDGEGIGTIIDDDEPAGGTRIIRAVNAAGQRGGQVTVQFILDAVGNESSTSFSFNYDQTRLTNPVITLGSGVPAGSNLGTNLNQTAQGRIGVLVDSTNTYAAGARQLITARFDIPANAQIGIVPITFSSVPTPQSVSSSAGALLPTTYQTGSVQIGSTAAGVSVSGRVLTPTGQGIRNAIVTMTAADGTSRRATTSSFGTYTFDTVEAGSSYVVGVSSKRYRFAPRALQIADDITGLDLVGLE